MDHQQNSTATKDKRDEFIIPVPFTMLTPQQQYWVDYNVVQGLITESDGEMKKVSVNQFAEKLGVDRTTLYSWTRRIPNFWDLVDERRKVLFRHGARTAKVWNSLFIAATVKLNVQAQSLWLLNADKSFKIPSTKVEHSATGGLADLIDSARGIKDKHDNVIEGEVVNNEPTNNS